MDSVTVDLLFTLLISLCLVLTSMLALRLLPSSAEEIHADAMALGRVRAQLWQVVVPVLRPAYVRLGR